MSDSRPIPDRHARHVALPQVGSDGQARISNATALLIGVGGIGCATATYLASSGVGHLMICDFDTVDPTNLGRQVLFGPADVGELKATVAAERLASCNPDIEITPIIDRLSDEALAEAVAKADVVLDGSDNFATRFQVNEACVAAKRCLISGSTIRLEGQVVVFGPDYKTSPCYRCVYSAADESLENCAGNGVLAPVPGVIGSMMAVEALKFLVGLTSPRGVLQLYDAGSGGFHSAQIGKHPKCPVCR
jgi:molybdopterin/thiamine biosynthesis adenylyltransferase